MEDHQFTSTKDDTVPLPVSPRQNEFQGRPHGKSTVAPITPEIGVTGCDVDDIHGAKAVDILEIQDLTTHLNNTTRHEDLANTIRRLEEENKALREGNAEDIKEAEESVCIITALHQRLNNEKDDRLWKRTLPRERVRGPFRISQRAPATECMRGHIW